MKIIIFYYDCRKSGIVEEIMSGLETFKRGAPEIFLEKYCGINIILLITVLILRILSLILNWITFLSRRTFYCSSYSYGYVIADSKLWYDSLNTRSCRYMHNSACRWRIAENVKIFSSNVNHFLILPRIRKIESRLVCANKFSSISQWYFLIEDSETKLELASFLNFYEKSLQSYKKLITSL